MDDIALSEGVIGCAIEVHRHLGPGLLESTYEDCLCFELAAEGITFERQLQLPVTYKGAKLDAGYRLDILVASRLVVEVKAVERIVAIHEAQLLTYLRMSGHRVGLILNFNHAVLKDGIRRLAL